MPTHTDGRTQRWESHKEARRTHILDAAVDVVGQQGHVANVMDIARQAGVQRSVIYRLFADREDLDDQVRRRIVSDLVALLGPKLKLDGSIEESIRRAVDTYIDWIATNPQLHHFLSVGSARKPSPGSPVLTSAKADLSNQLARTIEHTLPEMGVDTRYAEPLAYAIAGMVDATVNHWLRTPSATRISAEELSRYLSRSTWHIVRGTLADLGADETEPAAVVAATTTL